MEQWNQEAAETEWNIGIKGRFGPNGTMEWEGNKKRMGILEEELG